MADSPDIDALIRRTNEAQPSLAVDPSTYEQRPGETSEDRIRRFARANVDAGLTSQQAEDNARSRFGDVRNYGELHQRATQDRDLERERQRASGKEESWSHYLAQAIPFRSVGELPWHIQHTNALERYRSGRASPEDLRTIAERERYGQILTNETTGQQIGRSLLGVVSNVGEAAIGSGLGGAAASQVGRLGAAAAPSAAGRAASFVGTLAAMPSTYLDQAVARNTEQGRAATDWRGFPAAVTMGALQVAVLGSLGRVGNSITGQSILPVASRLLARTATGLTEQHLFVEPLAQAVSHVLPQAYRLETGDGLLSNAFQGKWGEAWKQLAVSTVTFAAFSGLHELQSGASKATPLLGTMEAAMRHMSEAGIPRDQIPGRIQDINHWIMQGHAGPQIETMPEGPLKAYAQAMEKTAGITRQAQAEEPQPPSDPSVTQGPGPLADWWQAQNPRVEPSPGPQQGPPQPAPQPAPQGAPQPTPQAPSPEGAPPAFPARPGMPAAQRGIESARSTAANLDGSLGRIFEGSQRLSRVHPDGTVEHGILVETPSGNRQIHVEMNPNARTMKIDFRNETGEASKIGEQYQKGSIQFAKKIRGIVEWAAENHVGIISEGKVDIDPKTGRIDRTRQQTYDRILAKAGFEKGEDGTWRKSPMDQVGHPDAKAELSDLRGHYGSEKVEIVSGLVDHALDVASRAGRLDNIAEVLKAEVPGLKKALGTEFPKFVEKLKETVDAEAAIRGAEPGREAPVSGEAQQPVQKEAGPGENPSANQGGPEVQPAEAAQGPAQAPGAGQGDIAPNAPAGAGGGAAGRDLVTASPQWRAIKEAKTALTAALNSGHMQSIVKAQDRLRDLTSSVNTPEMRQLMRSRSPEELARPTGAPESSGHLSNPKLVDAMRDNPEMTIEQAQKHLETAPGQEEAKPGVGDLIFSERASFSHGEAWDNIKAGLKKMWDFSKGIAQHFGDIEKQLGGQIYPKTARKAPATNEALVSFIKSGEEAHLRSEGDKIKEGELRSRFEKERKPEIFKAAEQEGVGFWGKIGERTGRYEDMHEIKDGHRSFYVHDADVAHDFNEALHHEPVKFKTLEGAVNVANMATLAGPTEMIFHSKNILTTIMNPGVAWKMIGGIKKVISGSPEMQKQLADLAHIGVSVGQHREGSAWNPMNHLGNALHFVRKATILAADDAFTMLAKNPLFKDEIKDTASNRRNFLNQMGQYEIKGQNKFVQLLRETGLGPFATAATNFWVQGLRTLTGNTGIETNTWRGQAMLRSAKYGNIAAVAGITAGLNYLINGRVDGDDHTPLGALKLGVDKSGKTQYFDLVNLTGLTRGARETGLLALAEGLRHGERGGAILDKAKSDILHAAMHPMTGPIVQAGYTAATGQNTMGMRLTPRVSDSHTTDNLRAAALNLNPAVGALTGANRSPEAQSLTGSERAMALAGPFGVRTKEPLSQYRSEFHDLTEQRQLAHQATPGRFEDEARYQRLNRIHAAIAQIDKQLKTASEDRRVDLRRRQNELAALALSH